MMTFLKWFDLFKDDPISIIVKDKSEWSFKKFPIKLLIIKTMTPEQTAAFQALADQFQINFSVTTEVVVTTPTTVDFNHA